MDDFSAKYRMVDATEDHPFDEVFSKETGVRLFRLMRMFSVGDRYVKRCEVAEGIECEWYAPIFEDDQRLKGVLFKIRNEEIPILIELDDHVRTEMILPCLEEDGGHVIGFDMVQNADDVQDIIKMHAPDIPVVH